MDVLSDCGQGNPSVKMDGSSYWWVIQQLYTQEFEEIFLELSHLPLVPHIYVSELDEHWFR